MMTINKISFKSKFISSFFKTIIFSLIITIIVVFIWLRYSSVFQNPANFYEQKLDDISYEISTFGVEVLNPNFQPTLDKIIEYKEIDYSVITNDGEYIYGDYFNNLINNETDFFTNINRTIRGNTSHFYYVKPILNQNEINGAIILRYKLKATPKINNLTFILFNSLIFTPFISIIAFSIHYGKKISKDLNEPISELLAASNNIKNKNLDFHLNYDNQDEFNDLFAAFNNMKNELESTLILNWEQEELKKENLSAITHDLKTPLTIVKNYSELLLSSEETKNTKIISAIHRNNNRAIHMVNNLSKISYLDYDNYTLKTKKIDVEVYLREILNDYSTLAKTYNIILKYHIFNNLNINYLYLDPYFINEILDNIISNSLKFTNDSGLIDINIEVNQSNLVFSIQDSGPGFLSNNLDDIFKKFYKEDISRSIDKSSSGIGLYIAKNLIHLHGGVISAKNNNGALIVFNLKSIK